MNIGQNKYQNYEFGSYEFKLNSIHRKLNKCFFSGYASIFNIIDSQNDLILKGAFSESILQKKQKLILLWQHDHNQPIGKITKLKEDKNGLHISGELVLDISKAFDVYHMLKNDILDSFSIGYTPIKFSYKKTSDLNDIRIIEKLKLWEISLVTFPANNFAKLENISNIENPLKDYKEIDEYVFDKNHEQYF